MKLRLSGAADQLTVTWNHIVIDLLIAVAIVFLVMAVLFESFVYPLVIMVSVPLATAGGVLGLAVLNLFAFQPLDMLTLLGFIILVGIVVNNAILLVHQTLFHIREGNMTAADAIREATQDRLRPIYMSTLTSIFGMAPLVVFPGAGSELYRGLGLGGAGRAVALGGSDLGHHPAPARPDPSAAGRAPAGPRGRRNRSGGSDPAGPAAGRAKTRMKRLSETRPE